MMDDEKVNPLWGALMDIQEFGGEVEAGAIVLRESVENSGEEPEINEEVTLAAQDLIYALTVMLETIDIENAIAQIKESFLPSED